MGGKPDTSAADQANALAAQQAKEAKEKERLRQERLDTGYTKIRNIFEGAPVMGTRQTAFDWSKMKAPTSAAAARTGGQQINGTVWGNADPAALQGSTLPTGYSWKQVAAPQTAAPTAPGRTGGLTQGKRRLTNIGSYKAVGNPEGKDYWSYEAPTTNVQARNAAPQQVWAIVGPDGKVHYQGEAFNYDESYDTGDRTGGFGDEFYGGITQHVRDLGNVDITDQYNKARENLQYALARQGLSSSSAANQGVADVEGAKAKAAGDLELQAQDAATKVRQQVDAEKQAAISQLYATEDPTLAANTALSKEATILADKPSYNPLGDIFGSVISGFGNVLSAARGGGYGTQKSPYARPAGG